MRWGRGLLFVLSFAVALGAHAAGLAAVPSAGAGVATALVWLGLLAARRRSAYRAAGAVICAGTTAGTPVHRWQGLVLVGVCAAYAVVRFIELRGRDGGFGMVFALTFPVVQTLFWLDSWRSRSHVHERGVTTEAGFVPWEAISEARFASGPLAGPNAEAYDVALFRARRSMFGLGDIVINIPRSARAALEARLDRLGLIAPELERRTVRG